MRVLPLLLLMACASTTSPHVEYVPTRPVAMQGAPLSYAVWTPPDFSESERLPLVVFLHGGGDDPSTFVRYGIADRLTEAVRAGTIPRVVMVFPQGDDGFWSNWYDGTRLYEDWIVDELMPEVVARWHTRTCPEACHVMGVSMGGYGALRMALNRPRRFASVSALSAPIFDTVRMQELADNRLYALFIPTHRIFGPGQPVSSIEDDDLFLRWTSRAEAGMPVFTAWATADRANLSDLNVRFAEHLTEHGIPHTSFEFEGTHSWVSWAPVIEQALRVQVEGETLDPAIVATP